MSVAIVTRLYLQYKMPAGYFEPNGVSPPSNPQKLTIYIQNVNPDTSGIHLEKLILWSTDKQRFNSTI